MAVNVCAPTNRFSIHKPTTKRTLNLLKDVSKNDWYKQYLISAEYMEKASSLYLGIDKPLPDIFYNPTDYHY